MKPRNEVECQNTGTVLMLSVYKTLLIKYGIFLKKGVYALQPQKMSGVRQNVSNGQKEAVSSIATYSRKLLI